MKKRNIKLQVLLLFTVSLLALSSCTQETEVEETQNAVQLTDNELRALLEVGINGYDREIRVVKDSPMLPSGGYAIGDYLISNDELGQRVKDMLNHKAGISLTQHYASTNRVNTNIGLRNGNRRTVRVAIVNFGNISLNQTVINGTFDAVQRYNSLNMNRLNMQFLQLNEAEARRRFANATIDVLIFNDVPNYTGVVGTNFDAIARFPNGGNPGNLIGLNPNGQRLDRTSAATLIMHELGHTLGMAHSDFFNRNSCAGSTGNPVGGPLGDLGNVANVNGVFHVPGTDTTGGFTDSIMRACNFFAFRSSTFRPQDQIAFRRLYQ